MVMKSKSSSSSCGGFFGEGARRAARRRLFFGEGARGAVVAASMGPMTGPHALVVPEYDGEDGGDGLLRVEPVLVHSMVTGERLLSLLLSPVIICFLSALVRYLAGDRVISLPLLSTTVFFVSSFSCIT